MAWKFLYNERLTVDYSSYEQFQRLRDFIGALNKTYDYSANGIGWTLWDENYSVDEDNITYGDYVVFKSLGEDGEAEIYMKLVCQSSAVITTQGFLYWNPTTHTAVKQFGSTSQGLVTNQGQYLHIYGNLDHIYMLNDQDPPDGTCHIHNAGRFLSSLHWTPIVITPTLTAGSDVTITVPDATLPRFDVGRGFFVHDEANLEKLVVKTNNGVDEITVDLVNSYTAGARLRGIIPYIMCVDQGTFFSGTSNDMQLLMSGAGLYPGSTTKALQGTMSQAQPSLGHYMASPYFMLDSVGGVDQTYENILYVIALTGVSKLDVFEAEDGSLWRWFSAGGKNTLFKES